MPSSTNELFIIIMMGLLCIICVHINEVAFTYLVRLFYSGSDATFIN